VREAFWKQTPGISEVLSELSHRRVFIVPMFMSEGHFSDSVIPRELGFVKESVDSYPKVQELGGRTISYCRTIGTHEQMANVILSYARELTGTYPFPRAPEASEITLFLVGHGTERNTNSRHAVDEHVARVRTLNQYAAVHGVFLDEEPRVEDCFRMATTKHFVVIPFLLGDGPHARKDIPLMLGAARKTVEQRLESGVRPWRNPTEIRGRLVWLSSAVGTARAVAEVVLLRATEAAAELAA
jgi:sirohydrochlorin cobaltochelatase